MAKGVNQSSLTDKRAKQHLIPDIDREFIKKIAATAKRMRILQGYSYEQFAIHAEINRNSYFRFEKSAQTGDNYTVALLLKVIRGLNKTATEFFQAIK